MIFIFIDIIITNQIIKVLICWDRFLSIRFNHWKTIYFKQPRPLITVICTVGLIVLINANILITFGYNERIENSTTVLSFCFQIPDVPSTVWMTTWGRVRICYLFWWRFFNPKLYHIKFKVHLGLYSIVPFLVIAGANFGLIYVIYQKKSSSKHTSAKDKSKTATLNATVFVMTCLFILMTSPIAMASFFFDSLFTTIYGQFIIVLVDFISFCYHGLNFVVMAFTNKLFFKEVRKILGLEDKSKQSRPSQFQTVVSTTKAPNKRSSISGE